jgi:hypothetical protein
LSKSENEDSHPLAIFGNPIPDGLLVVLPHAVFSRKVPNSAGAVWCCWILVLQIPELSPKMAVCKRSPVGEVSD